MSAFIDKISEYGFLTSDTGARAKLGTMVEMEDGRKFRYCENSGTAMVAGNLYQAPALVTNHQNIAVAAAAAIGAKSVTVTLGNTLATANDYSEGYMVVNDVDGEGHCYKIASHPAAAALASLVLTLEDPIKVALTTSSEVCLIPNPYKDPVISASAQTGTAVGVAPFAIAANSFGWLQTGGVASVYADEAITAGRAVVIGDTTAGQVSTLNAAGEVQVGVAIQAGVVDEYRAIMLTIN